MVSDESETDDSDLESSMVAWLDVPSSAPTSSAPDSSTNNFCEVVVTAIRTLQGVRLADILANVEDLHREILEASNTINKYLDGITSQSRDSLENLGLFASLVQPSFLAVLFAQRRIFHNMAVKALAPRVVASTVVCWVDGLIAKLAEVTIIIASGSTIHPIMSDVMRIQMDDDGLRAAAQLPEKWSMVPSVIGSPNTSPAAKRLAIQLAFSVYIVGPRLQRYDPWSDCDTPQAIELSKILNKYILTIPVDESTTLYSTQALVNQLCLTYAMIISLFAASDQNINRTQSFSPFRPRTLGSVLYMIQLIMRPAIVQEDDSTCITPCEHLDLAQILLLHWGDFMCWCWETWNDYRVANTECITQLTTTWLYHSQNGDSVPYQSIHNAHILLDKNPSAANQAIFQVLHHGTTSLPGQNATLQDSFYVVLLSACRAINHLLRNELVSGQKLAGAASTGKLLLSLLVSLHLDTAVDRRLELKSTILESLTMMDKGPFGKAVTDICGDEKMHFVERIDEFEKSSYGRGLVQPTGTESDQNISNTQAEELRLVLYFLTLCWNAPEGRKHIQRQPILSFLASLTNRLLKGEMNPSSGSDYLREAVITGFCILDKYPTISIKSPKQEDVWKFVLDAGCSNLVVTSSFAHHIITTARLPDPLACAEAWDHLRDTMTLVFRRQFLEDEQAMALIVSPGICGALLRLLDAEASAGTQVISSIHFDN
ncbi:hypothetical protein J3R30DRAFT_3697805 [Lentinula aciculospora]|uniref:Uncharacterized protein n=1 Tax=Lentinula aciculospora TaxID=153920 RepID=A0A9W9ANU0_9AGAR|nr:hypothetical protein J3R30DRAFT_3697805 [Lentinula aciculospora]